MEEKMWIRYDKFGDLHDAYLLTLGRAMLLAQSFESDIFPVRKALQDG
jgi:hypothetical protein